MRSILLGSRPHAKFKAEGCEVIRSEKVSGGSREGGAELAAILLFLRPGDELVVTRLCRPGEGQLRLADPLPHRPPYRAAAILPSTRERAGRRRGRLSSRTGLCWRCRNFGPRSRFSQQTRECTSGQRVGSGPAPELTHLAVNRGGEYMKSCKCDPGPTPESVSVGGSVKRERDLHSEPRRWSQWDFIEALGDGIYGVDREGRCTFVNRAAQDALGYASAEELVGGNMHDLIHHTRQDGSPYPQEDCPLLHTLTTGRSVRLENEMLWRKDGTSFIAEYSSFPIISDGAVTGSVITFSDVSFRQEAQNRHAVQYAVSQVLAGSADLISAPARTLAAIGSGLGWDFGTFWISKLDSNEIPRLHCVADWHGAHSTPASELLHTSEVLRFGRGEGLPGRAWAEDGPVYTADLATDLSLPRRDDAVKDGLRTGLAFPVKAGGETVGVIEFFSRRRIAVDDSLREAVATLGQQIGQFIKRSRIEEELRDSEALKAAILEIGARLCGHHRCGQPDS